MPFKIGDKIESLGRQSVIVSDFVNLSGIPYYVLEYGNGRLETRSHEYGDTRFILINSAKEDQT